MRLANLDDPLFPGALKKYADDRNYRVIEVSGRDEQFNDVTKTINSCLDHARKKGCEEFCFGKIQYKYNIGDDTHSWIVSIFGFLK